MYDGHASRAEEVVLEEIICGVDGGADAHAKEAEVLTRGYEVAPL
jgi:hypothetical protein